MKKSIIMTVILSFSVLFSIGASSLSAEAKMSNTESDNIPYTQQKFSFTASNGETISYYVCLPKGYDDTTDYPLVVYMHGIGGDTDTSGYEYLRTEIFKRGYKAVIIAPIASWSGGQEWIDRTVLVGEGPRKDYNQDELTATKALVAAKELIEQSKNTYHTIRKRTYCVGVSMGGYGTYELITRYPGLIDAAVPICGAGDISKASLLSALPVWAFHGTADAAVDYNSDKALADAIVALGNPNFRFTTYEGVDHGIWYKAMSEPDMLPWLFSQNNGIYETKASYTAENGKAFLDVKIKIKFSDASKITVKANGKPVSMQTYTEQNGYVWMSCEDFLNDATQIEITGNVAESFVTYRFAETTVSWVDPIIVNENPWNGEQTDSSWDGVDDLNDLSFIVQSSNVKTISDPYIKQTVIYKDASGESGYFMYSVKNRYITDVKISLSAIPGFLPYDVNGFVKLFAVTEEGGAENEITLSRDDGVLIYENSNPTYNYYGYNVQCDTLPADTLCVKIEIAEKYVNYTICIDKVELTLEPINPDEPDDESEPESKEESVTENSDESEAESKEELTTESKEESVAESKAEGKSEVSEKNTSSEESEPESKGISPWLYIIPGAVVIIVAAVIIISKLFK